MATKTSIVMTSYNPTHTLQEMTMATLANIVRYTNREDYELILVDCVPGDAQPGTQIRDDYHVLDIDKILRPDPDPGYPAAMNLGFQEAKNDYICFIENDIFVFEGWLDNLRWYLDNNILDAIVPDQVPRAREDYLERHNLDYMDALNKGGPEQGLLLIKRDAFLRTGTWAEDHRIVGWKYFYEQMANNNVRFGNTSRTTVSHICGATYMYHADFHREGLTD